MQCADHAAATATAQQHRQQQQQQVYSSSLGYSMASFRYRRAYAALCCVTQEVMQPAAVHTAQHTVCAARPCHRCCYSDPSQTGVNAGAPNMHACFLNPD